MRRRRYGGLAQCRSRRRASIGAVGSVGPKALVADDAFTTPLYGRRSPLADNVRDDDQPRPRGRAGRSPRSPARRRQRPTSSSGTPPSPASWCNGAPGTSGLGCGRQLTDRVGRGDGRRSTATRAAAGRRPAVRRAHQCFARVALVAPVRARAVGSASLRQRSRPRLTLTPRRPGRGSRRSLGRRLSHRDAAHDGPHHRVFGDRSAADVAKERPDRMCELLGMVEICKVRSGGPCDLHAEPLGEPSGGLSEEREAGGPARGLSTRRSRPAESSAPQSAPASPGRSLARPRRRDTRTGRPAARAAARPRRHARA